MGYVKFTKASSDAFSSSSKDDETLYFVNSTGDFSNESLEETGELFLGEKKITPSSVASSDVASKLKTPRNIKPVDAVVSDGALFDGSKNITIPISSVNADYVNFQTDLKDSDSNFVSCPSYASYNKELGANRLAQFGYQHITIENTVNGGAMWSRGSFTDEIKRKFINGTNKLSLKGVVFTSSYTNQHQLRVTYDFSGARLSVTAEHLMLKVNCGGATNFMCKIEKSLSSAPNTFSQVCSGQLKGKDEWNSFDFSIDDRLIINTSDGVSISKLRFTFYVTDTSPQGDVPSISSIQLYGGFIKSDNLVAVTGDKFSFNRNNEINTPYPIRINNLGNSATSDHALVADSLTDNPISTLESEFTFSPVSDISESSDDSVDSVTIKTIKGNTVFFNQLLQNGNFENGTTGWESTNTTISIENNKLKVVNNADTSNSIIQNISLSKGHKVLVTTAFKRNVSTDINCSFRLGKDASLFELYTVSIASSSRQVVTGILTTSTEINRLLFFPTAVGQGNETLVDYVALYDLTMMFGEGNEPTEEEFFKLFLNHYYPYNTGELMSLNTQSIKTVGFNQLNLMRTERVSIVSTPTTPKDFNENQIWLNFAYNGYSNTNSYDIQELTSNKIVAVSSSQAISGYGLGFPIKVFPNTSYYVNSGGTNENIVIGFFDYRGVNISSFPTNQQNKTFTTPADCVWCVVVLKASANNIEVTVENPVLNLSHTGYRNGDYEVYKQEERQLPIKTYFPNGMNANDYAFDELTQTHAIQRVKVVNVEEMGWKMAEQGIFAVDDYMPFPQHPTSDRKIRCDWNYTCDPDSVADMCYNLVDEGSIYVHDSSCSTLEAFITKNTGKKMIIDLDTPIKTSVEEPVIMDSTADVYSTIESVSSYASSPFIAAVYFGFNLLDTVKTDHRNIAMLIDEVDELSSNTKFYIKGRGTTAGEWIGFDERITEYYDGLNVYFYINIAGSTTTTLNINGLGAKTIYRGGTTKLTTQYPVDSVVNLVYSSTLNDGCWLTVPYDYDTNTNYSLLDNSQPMAGGVGIFPYSLCALNVDGKMESFTTSGGTGTDKEANTTAKFPIGTKIHYYNGTTTIPSDSRMPTNTNYYVYNAVNINYTSNFSGTTGATSFGQYQHAFLKVTVNSDNTWSPAAYSETNSVIVRFDELEPDCYYIYIGHTYYSSYYQVALNINNPLYYYDGKLLENADIAVINTGTFLEPGIPTKVARVGGRDITVTMPEVSSQNYSCRIRQYYVTYVVLTPTSVNTDYEVITFKAGGEDFNKALVSGTFHIKFETVGSELAQKAGVSIKIKDANGKIIRKFDQTIPPLQGMHLISFNAFLNTLAGTGSDYSVTFSINALAGFITLTGYDQEKYDNNFSEIIITESKG